MSEPPSIWNELKRRKVVRVAVVYAATSFAVLQAADIMLPQMNVPDWAMGLVVAFVVFGFPIALVLGWALELTPDGIRRTDAAPAAASDAPPPALVGKRTVFAAALLVAVGFGLGAGWLLKPAADAPAGLSGSVPAIAGPAPGAGGEEAAAAGEPGKNSIAVLPFLNMSADPANEFFADGISEELLNILAGVEGLKVASRTSAFSFKGKDIPIPQIARELNVRHILEGSVRRQGDRVRITAQLIETRGDTHLWSETFERDLVDIFRVQEEIAQAITAALRDVLGVQAVSVAPATTDLEAYERFLSGRSKFSQRTRLDEAIADLRFAVGRDPRFAEAWAFLAAASFVVGTGGYPTEQDRGALTASAMEASERALALDPDQPTGLAVKGQLLTRTGRAAQIAEGIRLLERAAERGSADTSADLWLGLVWVQLGFVERALPHLERAQEQDPLVAINNGWLGVAYALDGRWEEAGRRVKRSVELSPVPFWMVIVVIGLVHDGREDEALRLLQSAQRAQKVPLEYGDWVDGLTAALENPALRGEFRAAYRHDPQQDNGAEAMFVALMFRDADHLFEFEDTTGARLIMTVSAWLPSLGWLREDPRFFASMRRTGLASYWELEGYPKGCRRVEDAAGPRLDCERAGQ